MAEPTHAPLTYVPEKTFSSYNQEQGKLYAQTRRDYHPNLYQAVLKQHTSTGGKLDTVVDVGCGPGMAALALAPYFAHTIGLDPSEGMVANARSFAGSRSNSESIRFEVSTAEELGQHLSQPIEDSSVDLITAANAAHWFDLANFWPAAARILRPGGSVALWTSGDIRTHPSMPNAAAIQSAIDQYEEHHLKPYFEPGNLLTRSRYKNLALPWTLSEPVPEFEKNTFFRKDWEDGELFYIGETEVGLDTLEKMMGTGSAAVRWRQAHPEDVGTERDIIKTLRKDIERLLHEAGVEKGKEKIKGTVRGVLLMVKKKL